MTSKDIESLFERQLNTSEHFNKVFSELENVKTRTIDFGSFYYVLQFNPGRILSATADTNKKVVSENCFLCENHRFPLQIGIEYNENYEIFVNPYPIFKKHFTIVDKKHLPQEITGEEKTIVKMSKDLCGYTVFYNSRHSGASAPFHRHFQACKTLEIPVFNQWEALWKSTKFFEKELPESGKICLINDSTRIFYLLETESELQAANALTDILNTLKSVFKTESPEANVGVSFDGKKFRTVIFPRSKHRPKEYFETGASHLTISPGFADMAGIIPCAVETDFLKLNKEIITSIFTQVSIELHYANSLTILDS